jgi:putative hydrolase of HD superfamily
MLSYRLKALRRSGWVRHGVPEPESVAAHSWGVSLLVMVFCPPDLHRERAMEYATVHDLAECLVGDLTPYDGVDRAEKARRELEAMRTLCARLPRGAALLATWERYEAQQDAESRLVRQLDRLDMALQARAYQEAGTTGLQEFAESARSAISDPHLLHWLAACVQEPAATAATTTP